jgi:predicted PurR-regulated permease PerM
VNPNPQAYTTSCYIRDKGLFSVVALITKPLSTIVNAVQETRHPGLSIVTMGTIVAILYFGRVFFITSLAALIIAFILEPFVALLMRVRFPRSLASFVVCSIALLLLYVLGLGAYSQLSGLYNEMPKYGQHIGDLVDNVQQRIAAMEDQTYRMLVPARQRQEEERRRQQDQAQAAARRNNKKGAAAATPPVSGTTPSGPTPSGAIQEVRIHEERTPIGDYIYSRLSSFYQILLMASFVPFLVYFMLSWRDHINRSFLQFFHGEDRLIATRSVQGIADMVRAFVVGNFVLGMLLAIISATLFWLMGVPYPMLVGPLSGVLSLVPYIGLPLAMVPPLFAALPLNAVPVYALVVLTVGMLHLTALNLLYPKIVGSRVHLNPLVVTFSLMFWGFLWDAPGLLLAIPLTAGIKAVCDNVKGLRAFGKFLGD